MNKHKFGHTALTGAVLALAFPALGHAASAPGFGSVQFCVAEGAGHVSVSRSNSPSMHDTGRLAATVSGTNNLTYSPATGTYGGSYTVATTPACQIVPWDGSQPGSSTASLLGPLDAPCYQTVNGDLVNPPYLVGNQSNPAHTPRCEGKAYRIYTSVDGATPTLAPGTDQYSFQFFPGHDLQIIFQVTDVRFFGCTSQLGPGQTGVPGSISNGPDSGRVCEPNGPTGAPPAS